MVDSILEEEYGDILGYNLKETFYKKQYLLYCVASYQKEAYGTLLKLEDYIAKIPVWKKFFKTLQDSIVGEKTPAGFSKLLLESHKFSASRNALLKTGKEVIEWPSLIKDTSFVSKDGRYEVVNLRDSKDLVMEGLKMHHCVGSYVDDCLRGTTHIFSFRDRHQDNKPVATLQVNFSHEEKLKLKFCQFKGEFNRTPGQGAYNAYWEFKKAIIDKKLSLNTKEIIEYIRTEKPQLYQTQNKNEKLHLLWPFWKILLKSLKEDETPRQWADRIGITQAVKETWRSYHQKEILQNEQSSLVSR